MGLMKIILGIILLIMGLLFTITLIGAIIGIPLIIISLLLIISGLIPKNIFKKTIKIVFRVTTAFLVVFIIFAGITLIFDSGKDFWNNTIIVPIMKPFSEGCGSVDLGYKTICDCDGTMLRRTTKGPTEYYCYGTCGECHCTQWNETSQEYEKSSCELKIIKTNETGN